MMKPALVNPTTNILVKKQLKRHGFALVSTITVMMLLLMIGLGVISLSTISSKGATQDRYAAEAQANARLALSIAIGQLQKYAGPDQRVTATASILDTDPESEAIDGVEHQHWVGVWKTNGLKGSTSDTPFIHPTQDGPLIDDRANNYEKSDQVLQWLVSGNQSSPQSTLNNPVILYNAASDSSDETKQTIREKSVYAEKVSLANKTGSYAYWVSDENTKANISLADDDSSDQPDMTNYETLYQVLSPNRFGLGNVFSDYAQLTNREIAKILTQNQSSLASMGSSPIDPDLKKAVKMLRHDVTTQSLSVLADPVKGGLKKNLTAYLESNGDVQGSGSMQGINDTTPILFDMPQRDLIGPKFGAIREWYNLKDQLSGQRGSQTIDMTFANYDSTYKTAELNNFTKQPIQPTLMEAVYQTNYSYDPVSRYIYELIYPRVVLWNPYNVRLKTPDLYVAFEFKGNDYYDMEYQYKDGNGRIQTDKIRTTINYNFGYGGNDRIIFTIPGTTFEPGECLQFTADPSGASLFSKAKPFARSNSGIGGNRLSASTDPTDLNCFYRFVKNSNGNGSNKQLRKDYIPNTIRMNYGGGILWHGDKPVQSVYLYAAKGGSGNPKFTDLGRDSFPAIQRYYIDNYSRGNNGRWLPGYRPPRVVEPIGNHLAQNIIPETIIGYGMRWKHFYESYSNRVYGKALREPWYYAPLVHNNVRARHIHRWDSDNMFGQVYTGAGTGSTAENTAYGSGRAHLYSWGPISQTRQFPAWNDPEVSPHYSADSGKFRTSPFFNNTFTSSEQVFPLFELPDTVISPQSLGQLQHVQFTPHVWHPSYVIGTGICSPYVDPQTTSLTFSDQRQSWQDKLNRLFEGNNDEVHLLSEAGDNPMIFDMAYETNYFMWDKYFLSSVPISGPSATWNNDKWDSNTPLPNSRMVLNTFDPSSNNRPDLTNYHKAANSLMIQGGFNVNSTSKLAWEALLRSFNGVKLPSRNGSNFSANPFSSLLISEKGAGSAASANEDLLWAGYRDLTDQEITLLAEKIVVQVKKRAPFIGVADFVNRRLDTPDGEDDEIEFFGALQAAINNSGINDRLDSSSPSDFNLPTAKEAEDNYTYGAEYWGGPTRTPHAQTYGSFEYQANGESQPVRLSKAEGAPGYLTQNDILQQVGSVLTARSDTFTIRAYGESLSTDGKVMAKAWCEATVQRIPEPINPDTTQAALNPIAGVENDPGRRFIITSFRWLQRNELEPAE